jgi:hypothetical protein
MKALEGALVAVATGAGALLVAWLSTWWFPAQWWYPLAVVCIAAVAWAHWWVWSGIDS